MTTVAAIDCGTNTIKLLVGERHRDEQGERLEVLADEMRVVRLGQGVDATGRLADEAIERTFAAIDEYAAIIAEHDVEKIRFCATSATRDADNAKAFRAGVLERLGVEPEVLSGDEEARVAFSGALSGLPEDVAMPVLVVDIGGGSTEVILGDHDGVRQARSMDIGSVRLHERHVRHDPVTPEEVEAVVRDIEAALDDSGVSVTEAATVVGIAGTMTQLAATILDLPAYDKRAIHRTTHAAADVHATVERLLSMTVAERLALPHMHPGRADVIGVGALIADRTLRRAGADRLLVVESDILEGIAWSME